MTSLPCPSRGRRSMTTSSLPRVSPRAIRRLGTTTSMVSTSWPEMRSGFRRIAVLPGTVSRACRRRERASKERSTTETSPVSSGSTATLGAPPSIDSAKMRASTPKRSCKPVFTAASRSMAVTRRAARVTTTWAKPWLRISPASRTMPAVRAASMIRATWMVPVSPSAGARKAAIAAASPERPGMRSPKVTRSRARLISGRSCSLDGSAAAAGAATAEATATGVGWTCCGAARAAVPERARAIRDRRIMMRIPP